MRTRVAVVIYVLLVSAGSDGRGSRNSVVDGIDTSERIDVDLQVRQCLISMLI